MQLTRVAVNRDMQIFLSLSTGSSLRCFSTRTKEIGGGDKSARVKRKSAAAYLLVRNTDVPCHRAAHRSHVPRRRRSRVPQISLGATLFRERLATVPVQPALVPFARLAQLVHLPQQITLLLFQHRHLHLQSARETCITKISPSFFLFLMISHWIGWRFSKISKDKVWKFIQEWTNFLWHW